MTSLDSVDFFDFPFQLNSSFHPNRIKLGEGEDLHLGFFSVASAWLRSALVNAKEGRRNRSNCEYEDVLENSYCQYVGSIAVEVISEGQIGILLVDFRPVALVNLKENSMHIDFFDYPSMDTREKHVFRALEASKSYYEIRSDNEMGLLLCYIREEFRNMNALKMVRAVNLLTGEVSCEVEVDRSEVHQSPEIQNLVDWIEEERTGE